MKERRALIVLTLPVNRYGISEVAGITYAILSREFCENRSLALLEYVVKQVFTHFVKCSFKLQLGFILHICV